MDLSELLITIAGLKTISEDEKNHLLGVVQQSQKELQRQAFKLKRIEKDKSIVTNILNATIADLEKKQTIINEANEQLLAQKKVIEKNAVLLEDSIQKLGRSYKELEEFSYIASHDLRSPLRTIASFAQLVKRRYYHLLDKDGIEFIDYIVNGVHEMDRIIQALLAYAQVDNQADVFGQTSVNEVLKVVKANLQTQITKHQVTIIHSDLPMIYGNRIGLIQLFQNLLSNAIKFRSDLDPEIKISYEKVGEKWLFKCEDNGIGIEEEFRKKVFVPFQRLDKQASSGMGIGLAICEKVVKMHQGDIHIEASPAGGTTFVFTLISQKKNAKELVPH